MAESQGQVVVVVEEKDQVEEVNHHKMAVLDRVMKVQAEAPSTQRVGQTGPDNMT